jgi:hypothetical protein
LHEIRKKEAKCHSVSPAQSRHNPPEPTTNPVMQNKPTNPISASKAAILAARRQNKPTKPNRLACAAPLSPARYHPPL